MQFPVGYTLKDFQYVADVMDKGHVDPKILVSAVEPLDDIARIFEKLRQANGETKVHISPF